MANKKWNNLVPIYKMYKDTGYTLSTLVKEQIFLQKVENYNDMFEGCLIFKFEDFKDKFIEKYGNKETTQEIFLQYTRYCDEIKKIRSSYYSCCFTTVEPELNCPMWSFYAGMNGLCFEFRLDSVNMDKYSCMFEKNYEYYIVRHLHSIKYIDVYSEIDINYLLTIPIEKVYKDKKITKQVEKSLLVKHKSWSHEKEIRLLIKEDEPFFKKNLNINFFTTKNGVYANFPFISVIYTIFNTHEKTKEFVNDFIIKKGFSHVELNRNLAEGKLYDSHQMSEEEMFMRLRDIMN